MRLAACGVQRGGGIGRLAQIAHGGKGRRYIHEYAVAHRHDRWAADIGPPDAPGQHGIGRIVRQHRLQRIEKLGHRHVLPNHRPAPYTMRSRNLNRRQD